VIPIYEAGEADRRLFIAMRWVEGTDLRSVIPARRAGSSIACRRPSTSSGPTSAW
jgi:hypothetical protein